MIKSIVNILKITPVLLLMLACSSSAHAAFSFSFVGGTLTLTQSTDDGNITIDNNGAGNAFQTNDGSGLVTYVAATNVVIDLLPNTTNQLDFDLDNAHTGFVTLNLGDGARDMNLTGTSNSIGGNLSINAGTDAQVLEIGVNSGLTVGGSMSIDLGVGFDTVDEDNNNIDITADMNFIGVNDFENGGTMNVGGNVVVDTSFEVEDTKFDDDATMTIIGNLTYTGGDGRDEVTLNGVAAGTSIGGNVIINVGDNTTGGNQFLFLNLPNTSVGGDLTATSTSSINLDSFALHPTTTVGGVIMVDLGDGSNDASFAGTNAGTTGSYQGGSGIDNVTMFVSGPAMDFTVQLLGAVDSFTLGGGTVLNSLSVDFGCGNDDVFVDGLGTPYPFPVTLRNLSGSCTIPTINFWGLLLMVGLLGLLGRVYKRKTS